MTTETTEIRLRPVTALDQEAVCTIVKQVFDEYGMTFDPTGWDKDVPNAHSHYSEPHAVFFVAEHRDGQVIGMAGAHLESGHDKLQAELHRLYISPEARGLGLGQKLCAHVEQWAFGHDAHTMVLWSDVRLVHAHALYRKRGYVLSDSRILGDPDQSVEFRMEKSRVNPSEPRLEPLTPELRTSARKMSFAEARSHETLWRKIMFTAAAISGARELVQRHPGKPNPIYPEWSDVFGKAFDPALAGAWVAESPSGAETVLGFTHGSETIWHPSCRTGR